MIGKKNFFLPTFVVFISIYRMELRNIFLFDFGDSFSLGMAGNNGEISNFIYKTGHLFIYLELYLYVSSSKENCSDFYI